MNHQPSNNIKHLNKKNKNYIIQRQKTSKNTENSTAENNSNSPGPLMRSFTRSRSSTSAPYARRPSTCDVSAVPSRTTRPLSAPPTTRRTGHGWSWSKSWTFSGGIAKCYPPKMLNFWSKLWISDDICGFRRITSVVFQGKFQNDGLHFVGKPQPYWDGEEDSRGPQLKWWPRRNLESLRAKHG